MKRSTCAYLVANLVGLLLCVLFVTWIIQTARIERRDNYDFGDSLNFLLTAVPVFLLSLLLNMGWGVKALIDICRRQDYRASLALAGVTAVWASSYLALRLMA